MPVMDKRTVQKQDSKGYQNSSRDAKYIYMYIKHNEVNRSKEAAAELLEAVQCSLHLK